MSQAQHMCGANGRSESPDWQAELQMLIAKAMAFEAYARPILARVPDITGDEPDGAFDGAPEWLCDLYDDVHAQPLRREAQVDNDPVQMLLRARNAAARMARPDVQFETGSGKRVFSRQDR